MNPELKEALNTETTERLFYYFKHDGSIDFEKKVIAGKILQERGFYKYKLVAEKEKIVEAIENLINDKNDPRKVKDQGRKELKKSILWAVLPWLIYLFAKVVDYLFDDEWEGSEINVLITFGVAFVAIVVFRTIFYRKNLKKFIQDRINDCDLQRSRLKVINEEWSF